MNDTKETFKLEDLPPASTLAPGTRVVVSAEAARGKGLLAAFTKKTHARSVRCSALLLRGYVGIEARTDPRTKQDLVFAVVP
ncbi:MAG TPA: hypothetical protein VGH87_12000 [Polyangiaceae bacterium]|nr:hypothetical protein [Polyangiaceae bacterium]